MPLQFTVAEIKVARVGRPGWPLPVSEAATTVSDARRTLEGTGIPFKNSESATFLNSSRRRLRSAAREKSGMTTCACGDSVKMKRKRERARGEREREKKGKEKKEESRRTRRGSNNNKMKERRVRLGRRTESVDGRKNLTRSPLVSLGSPNNSARPLNKQQFGMTARHPR